MEYMKTLKSNSVDCVITDPPYFLDTMDNKWSSESHEKRKSNSHIKKLPMGMKFDVEQGRRLMEYMSVLSKELFRVLRPGGFVLCFSSPRMYHNMVSGIESAGFEVRDQIVWCYNTSQVKAFRQDSIIDKDKKMNKLQKFMLKYKLRNHRTPQLKSGFEPICVCMKPIEGRFIDNMQKWGLGLMYVPNGVPENVIYIPKPSRKEKTNNPHPTVKPLELIRRLIELYCPKNGLVLDPFLGSGTTMIASLETNRKCIGSEINQEYIKIINDRLKEIGTEIAKDETDAE